MDNLVENIINKKTHCYFISPHLDDAVFSAGSLMSYLSGKVDITVINIFTSAGDGINTLSARSYLKQCKINNPKKLYEVRINEDNIALSKLNAKIFNLGFTEALWRKKQHSGKFRKFLSRYLPEFNSIYPFYRLNIISGKLHKEDEKLVIKVSRKIKSIVGKNNHNFKIFCPVGSGGHVDHLITRDACVKEFNDNLIYWSDFPYCLKLRKRNDFIENNDLGQHVFGKNADIKIKLCEAYSSQINRVIEDKRMLLRPEIFYLNDKRQKRFNTIAVTSMDKHLLKDWSNLWEESPFKNYFNSPDWFLACLETFKYPQYLILACYEDSKIVGILPLVKTKKYGISVFGSAGNQYYDKSSLLLLNNNHHILINLLEKLNKTGNYYLSEVDQTTANNALFYIRKLGIAKSSICPYLPFLSNPDKYLKKEVTNKILRKLEEEKDNIDFKVSIGKVKANLRDIIEIESESLKMKENKDIFSNKLFRKLCMKLDRLNSKNIMINFLFYKNEPICYQFNFLYNKTFIACSTAYKSRFKYLFPGKLLTYLLLKKLVKMGINTVDFSRGINEFKREFTPYSYQQYSICHASNPLITHWLTSLDLLKGQLEKHPTLFELIRKSFHDIKKLGELYGILINHYQSKLFGNRLKIQKYKLIL